MNEESVKIKEDAIHEVKDGIQVAFTNLGEENTKTSSSLIFISTIVPLGFLLDLKSKITVQSELIWIFLVIVAISLMLFLYNYLSKDYPADVGVDEIFVKNLSSYKYEEYLGDKFLKLKEIRSGTGKLLRQKALINKIATTLLAIGIIYLLILINL